MHMSRRSNERCNDLRLPAQHFDAWPDQTVVVCVCQQISHRSVRIAGSVSQKLDVHTLLAVASRLRLSLCALGDHHQLLVNARHGNKQLDTRYFSAASDLLVHSTGDLIQIRAESSKLTNQHRVRTADAALDSAMTLSRLRILKRHDTVKIQTTAKSIRHRHSDWQSALEPLKRRLRQSEGNEPERIRRFFRGHKSTVHVKQGSKGGTPSPAPDAAKLYTGRLAWVAAAQRSKTLSPISRCRDLSSRCRNFRFTRPDRLRSLQPQGRAWALRDAWTWRARRARARRLRETPSPPT